MKKTATSLLICLALLVVAAQAVVAATQTVTYSVSAINELSVSGNPAALAVSTATAGSEPDDATDATTTYGISTNQTGTKITAAIDTAMPAYSPLLSR